MDDGIDIEIDSSWQEARYLQPLLALCVWLSFGIIMQAP